MDDYPGDRRPSADRGADAVSAEAGQAGGAAARREAAAPIQLRARDGVDLDLSALVGTIWRRKFVIAGVALLFGLLAVVAVYALTPRYQATSVVMLDRSQDQIIDLQSVSSGLSADYFGIMAEPEVLRSRILAGRVVDAMNLTEHPDFNPLLRGDAAPGFPLSLVAAAVDLLKSTVRGAVTDREVPGASLLDEAFWARQRAVDLYLQSLTVTQVENTYVYRITVTATDPILAAHLADKHAELYILDQLESKFEATEAANAWLANRVADLQVDLEEAEAAVEAHISATSLISEEALSQVNRQLRDLRERRNDLTSAVQSAEASGLALRAAMEAGDVVAVAREAGQPRLAALAREIAALDGVAGAEAAREALTAQFAEAFEAVMARRELELERTGRQVEGLSASILSLEASLGTQTENLVQLRQLQREAEARGRIYEQFLRRLNETSVQVGVQQADARLLSPAVISFVPTFPRKTVTVLAALLMGGLIGTALVILLEQLNRSFRTAEDLEQTFGIGVLGQIPAAPVRARRSLLTYAVSRASSSLVEAIRNMRTGILLANMDRPPKAIMLTSSLPKEGKTTCSLLLAQNAAALGKKVLLVECDLRRRTFRSYFDIQGEHGLMSILTGEQPFEAVVHRDEASGIDVIPGQETKANAADVFSSRRFEEFVEMARARYDFVVVDTPPVLAVPDARVIAPLMDAVIYCVRWNSTHRELVRAGLQAFSQIKVRVTGLALTQINTRKMASYGYGGYGYYYYKTANQYYRN